MENERQRRKWVYSLAVILLEWGLLTAAALTYAYEIFQPNGILLIVGAVLVGFGAVVLWSEVLKDRWQPNPKSARYIRLALYHG